MTNHESNAKNVPLIPAPPPALTQADAQLTAISLMIDGGGYTIEDVIQFRLAQDGGKTLKEFVAEVRQHYQKRTWETYHTYLRFLCDGLMVPPDQFETAVKFAAAANLHTMTHVDQYDRDPDTGNVILFSGFGADALRRITEGDVVLTSRWLRVRVMLEYHRRNGSVDCDDVRWTGNNAVETLLTATTSIYRKAIKKNLVPAQHNPALDIPRPERSEAERRAMTDEEIAEIWRVLQLHSRDPELSCLLLQFHLETGARQCASWLLTRGDLRFERQAILITDKYGLPKEVPCSRQLLVDLDTFSRRRGQTEPSHHVFVLKSAGRSGADRPVVSRGYYERLHELIREHLGWAAEAGWTMHWCRHHAAAMIEAIAGLGVKERFLRHSLKKLPMVYGKPTFENVAWAVSVYTDQPHPKAVPPPMYWRRVPAVAA